MEFRKLLNIITEAAAPLSKNLKVMSLAQFLQSAGVEPKEEEVDEAKLGGATQRKLDKDDLTAYLDRIVGKKKEKTDKYKLPYIHSSNIPIVGDNGEKYDLDALTKSIINNQEQRTITTSNGTNFLTVSVFYCLAGQKERK